MICFGDDDDFEFCSGPSRGSDPHEHLRASAATPDGPFGNDEEVLREDPADGSPHDCIRPMPTRLWRSKQWRAWTSFLRGRSRLQQAS